MATPLPVTFRASPLPSSFRGTPQQLLDAMVARLALDTQETLTLFVTGSVAPTSDQGPWLKDGITWWVWDETSGSYIPEILDPKSLRYILSVTSPDPVAFDVWIVLDGYGKAQGIRTYSSGGWHDIYEDTIANIPTNAEQAAAIQAAVDTLNSTITTETTFYPAASFTAGSQTINTDGAPVKLALFTSVEFNPNSAYDGPSAKYVCPVNGYYAVTANVQVDNGTGDAPTMEIAIFISKNGSAFPMNTCSGGTSVASPPGARWYPDVQGMFSANANDYVEVWLSATDTVGTGNVTVANGDWSIHLVQRA